MKKRFNTLVLTLVVCYCLSILPMIFTGCANSSGGNGSGNENNSTASVSSVIGAAGGEVGDDNAMISIPAGALDSETTITVKYISNKKDVSDGPMLGFVGAVEFGPSGTKFKSPAEVAVKVTQSPKNETLSVFCYDEEKKKWKFETSAQILAGYATFEVNHFSKYRIVDVTPDLLQKYMDIIKSNFDNHIADTVSRQQYIDYLVNTVKVMDSYDEWNGRLYKACGFLISANYYIDGVEDDPNDLIYLYGEDSDQVKIGDLFYDSYSNHILNGEETDSSEVIIDVFLSINYKPVEVYNFSGHIAEEFEYDFDIYSSGWEWSYDGANHSTGSSGKITASTKGKEKVNVEYDYSGFIFIEDGTVNGSLSFENIKTKFVDEAALKKIHIIYYDTEGQPYDNQDNTVSLSLFNTRDICSNKVTCNLLGTCSNGICELAYDCKTKNLITIDGDWFLEGIGVGAGGSQSVTSSDAYSTMRIRVGGNNKPLLSFSIDPDELKEKQESEVAMVKDDFDFVLGLTSSMLEYYEASPELLSQLPDNIRRDSNDDFVFGSEFKIDGDITSIKTTQTITVEKKE